VPTHIYSYQVVVISNQKRISLQSELKGGRSESKSLSNFKERATAVMRQLDVPMSIYAATQYDEYRKPRMGMWKEMLDDYDLDVGEGVDLQDSVFRRGRRWTAGRPFMCRSVSSGLDLDRPRQADRCLFKVRESRC